MRLAAFGLHGLSPIALRIKPQSHKPENHVFVYRNGLGGSSDRASD